MSGPGAAFDLADAPPAKIGGVAVLLVAGDLAGAAADALCHVEVEAILLAGLERAFGDEGRDDLELRCACSGEISRPCLRQAHDGVRWIGVCEFVERERHGFSSLGCAGCEVKC